jgi:hypothetical protein
MTFELVGYTDDELALTAGYDDAVIRVTLVGNADIHAIAPITLFLEKLHHEALRLVAREVLVDFQQLEFMNSSCLKSFVTWISGVSETPPEHQYRIRFISNPELRWQRRSLHALSCFAADLVTVAP